MSIAERAPALDGLSDAEVAQRRAAGQTNVVSRGTSRDAWAIVRANVFTRFNAIIGVLLAVVLVFGPLQDGLFGLVIVVNSAVGIVQELRAKRTLDALALLERTPVQVRRDGAEVSIAPEEVVLDDPFPFLPRHITLVGALTIGIPGFFLALAPTTPSGPLQGSFAGCCARRCRPAWYAGWPRSPRTAWPGSTPTALRPPIAARPH